MASRDFVSRSTRMFLPEEFRKKNNDIVSHSIGTNEYYLYKKILIFGGINAIIPWADTDNVIDIAESVVGTNRSVDIDADSYRFLYIKHTGFTDLNEREVTTNRGIIFNLTGTDPTYNGTGVNVPILLRAKESIILRPSASLLNTLRIRPVVYDGDGAMTTSTYPTATEGVLVEIAAIIKDVA